MTQTTGVHRVQSGEGTIADLGVAQMRLLAAGEQTKKKFTLDEFKGGAGPWTIRHIHREMEESFFILEGAVYVHRRR